MREVVGTAAGYQKLLIISALCVTFLAAVPLAHANLLTNGSFETPTVQVGGFTLFASGSTFTGWTVTGPPGTNVGIVSGSFAQNGVTFQAFDGIQWLDLTGLNSNSTEGVSQAVATIAGHIYQLSYLIGNTTGGGIFGSTSTVNVLLNGAQTFSDTNSNTSASTLNWVPVSHTFTANGALTTLLFQNGDPGTDNSNGLDNVVLLDLGAGGVGEVLFPSRPRCCCSWWASLVCASPSRGETDRSRTRAFSTSRSRSSRGATD